MSVLNSVYVGLFGMSVVFVVLLGLSLFLRLEAALVKRFSGKNASRADQPEVPDALAAATEAEPLQLINVDEKTAAIVMAIVCDEMGVQPEELNFKSIKALGKSNDKVRN